MLTVALVVPVEARGEGPAAHWANVEQARALGRAGADAHLFVDGAEPGVSAIGPRAWLHVVRRSRAGRGVGHLVRAAERIRPDVLHVFHVLRAGAIARAALVPARVFAEYNGGSVPSGPIRRAVLRAATDALAGVFFTARPLAESFIEAGALSRRVPIHEVPEISSVLPLHPGRQAARAEIGGGSPLVLVVARAEPPKDPGCALAAFRAIAELEPEARLVWAALAPGIEMEKVRRAIAADPLVAPRARIETGVPRDAMPGLYAAADVMLHTSRREVCGAAFVEALAAGLPIAASDIPAFRALAAAGAVQLCPPGDAGAFARAALDLVAKPDARELARAHFLAELSYDAIAARKLRAYAR